MKRQISFFCAVVAGVVFLTATTFGQVLKVEPEKPKSGDKLKITYDPSALDADVTLEPRFSVRAHKFQVDGSYQVETALMKKVGKMLTCEVTVDNDVSFVQSHIGSPGKI